MTRPKYTPEQRISAFWNKVNKDGSMPQYCPELGQCWEWIIVPKCEYGKFWSNGKHVYAHRFSWELVNGEIPDGLFVLHKCDNRSCVNPEHLFLGTCQDNTNDMINKGRMEHASGEKAGAAKLTENIVREIRIRYAKGGVTLKSLSIEYSVSLSTIHFAITRKNWKYVK